MASCEASRAPVLFVSHGAPTVALDPGAFGADLASFAARLPRPRAILAVSAHWTTGSEIRITGAARNKLVYDFSGFPPEMYELRWPAPGAPDVAARAVSHLEAAGFRARLDPSRGLDHGVWVPLRIAWPQADVPVVQASLPQVPPAALVQVGAALAPLREEGVLLLFTGGVVHNLMQLRWDAPEGPAAEPWAAAFDAWVAARLDPLDVAGLARWREDAPHAALAAPTSEHLDPLLVAIGAAQHGDVPTTIHAGFTFGTLSMRSIAFLPPGGPAATTEARKEQAS
ncbi:DODA-type extradiol aromatic ring-opening family dioxygenase [Anaeromyxobacter oryzae]|uniref:Dioxygenase n=1 Tax=Anaeromyxobacter oryzae TaxID=2918170 RepID=A0ABN6MP04_9BACT|nr:class III extradiol ring-cleavage dioxygenase [Anaeromyxobacter oryzae]BDG02769.1 dioxygenase [Anaeromyxobacter oryzae]